MYDKFGEFDSAEELNQAAAGLLFEGDLTSLKELGAENGIDEADVQDYIDGYADELATVSMAAFGKLAAEEQSIKDKKEYQQAARVIFPMVRGLCLKESFCRAVMKKGKRVMNVYEEMKKEASNHKTGSMATACGTDRELSNIIKAYYLEDEASLIKTLKDLYQ